MKYRILGKDGPEIPVIARFGLVQHKIHHSFDPLQSIRCFVWSPGLAGFDEDSP